MSAGENKAVLLSYASQDAETALRIAEALRAVGVAAWFDQSELRGGDAWDGAPDARFLVWSFGFGVVL